MTLYLSGCTNPPTAAAARRTPRLGMLAQPGNCVHLQSKNYTSWGIDNGAFGKARKGKPWTDEDTAEYLTWLRRIRGEVDTSNVLFATAPDVLSFVDGAPRGDAKATWARGLEVFPLIRGARLPVALVAQDGINDMQIDYDQFDVLFLGGSDEFKLGHEGWIATQRALRAGKWVHMGRVNSFKRFAYANRIGCDSADGTYIGFGPNKNLPKVLSWLARTTPKAAAVAA